MRSHTPENSRIPARILSSADIIRACLTFASRAKRASSAIRVSMAGIVAGRTARCKPEFRVFSNRQALRFNWAWRLKTVATIPLQQPGEDLLFR